ITIHIIGFVLCFTILVISIVEKFAEGGWITLVITSALILVCYGIRWQYNRTTTRLKQLDDSLINLPFTPDLKPTPALDRSAETAALIVRNFHGLGIHSLLTIPRLFPNYFKNIVFISVGVIDSSTFKALKKSRTCDTRPKRIFGASSSTPIVWAGRRNIVWA